MFCGTREGVELATHYASGDLFLFPSLTETYGNVVLEAMASGLAVVAFDYAGARELLAAGRGVLVPRGEEAAFLAEVCQLAALPSQRRALGRRACAGARAHDWDAVVGRFEAHLAAVAAD